jgi:class 3 adenylate cyclase
MHQQFRELLPRATGESKLVIAANLDVRGFSKFSLERDSADTAVYVRKVYERILSEYYTDASYFKPTGDGLLLVFELDENDSTGLKDRANSVVETAFRLVEDFPTLLKDDEWIYFPVPQHLGIGLARGAAARLTVDQLTLDYSGSVLNAASRLMDLARPRGIIIDQTFPCSLLTEELTDRLTRDDNVFVRSIAEKLPTIIYHSGEVEINAQNRRPFDAVVWEAMTETLTLKTMTESDSFLFPLPARPLDPAKIVARIDYPGISKAGRRQPGLLNEYKVPSGFLTYDDDAGENRVSLRYREIASQLRALGVKRDWPLKLVIRLPV